MSTGIKMHTRYALRPAPGIPLYYMEQLKYLTGRKNQHTYKTRQEALTDRNWRIASNVRDAGGSPDLLEAYEVLTFSDTRWTRLKIAWRKTWAEKDEIGPANLGVLAGVGLLLGLGVAIIGGVALLTGVHFTMPGIVLACTIPALFIVADLIGFISTMMWHMPVAKEHPFTAEGMFAGMLKV